MLDENNELKNGVVAGSRETISSLIVLLSTFKIVVKDEPLCEKLKDCISVFGEYFKFAFLSFFFGSNQKYLTKYVPLFSSVTIFCSLKLSIKPISSAREISAEDALPPLTEKGNSSYNSG